VPTEPAPRGIVAIERTVDTPDRPAALPAWLRVAGATAIASIAGDGAGIPAPSLFAGLLVGLAWAVIGRRRLAPARPLVVAAHALVGASLGAYLQPDTLAGAAQRWPVVALGVLGTLVASLLAGLLLTAVTGLDRPTALLGLVAGGAGGLVTMSDELGADGRLVALMQYLRVLVVVTLAPLVVAVALSEGGSGAPPPSTAGGPGLAAGVVFTTAACSAGLLTARYTRLPAGALLGSMLVGGVLTVSGAVDGAEVPGPVQDLAFAAIGLQAGLRFTPARLRYARNLMPAVLAAIGLLVALCAGLGALIAALADVTMLDAYLATTPGGIYAVLATAVGSNADATFVLAVQTLRLFVMIVTAPPLVRLLGGDRVGVDRVEHGT
jgi:membrane AbrB-like protein